MASNVIQAIKEYYSEESTVSEYAIQNALASYEKQEIYLDDFVDDLFDGSI